MRGRNIVANKRLADYDEKTFPFQVLHIDEPAQNMSMFHWHEYMEISYIKAGKGLYEIEDKQFSVEKGDIIIINGIEKHRVTYCDSMPLFETVVHFDQSLLWSRDTVTLDYSYLKLFSTGADFCNKPSLNEVSSRIVALFMQEMVDEYTTKKPYYELFIKSKLLGLIAYLLRQDGNNPINVQEMTERRKKIKRLEDILEYIDNNFDRDLKLEEIADKFFVSNSYFSEYFKKNIGINFSEYLMRTRVNEAIKLIEESKLNSTQIAFCCGFNNTASFYNAFKKVTGKSRKEFSERT